MGDKLRNSVIEKAGTKELDKVAREEGMIPLFRDGLRKIRDGRTTTDEVVRALGAAAYLETRGVGSGEHPVRREGK
jgi:type II secretory ATPase GspE/PulE/Tfp pilus assembly ATPase PilB-like protein